MNDSRTHSSERLDYSLSIRQAYVQMLVIALPLTGVLALLYLAAWGVGNLLVGASRFVQLASLLLALFVGIPLHELIHGIAWIYFGKQTLKDAEFGVDWKTLTPYAHLKVRIPVTAYRLGALIPAVLLGCVPYAIGLLTGEAWFAIFGLFFLFGAGGDLLIVWLIRHVDRSALVEDHPSRAGCYVYPAGKRQEPYTY